MKRATFVAAPLLRLPLHFQRRPILRRHVSINLCVAQPKNNKLMLVGLGNPGPRFKDTRHNVGFEVADLFAARTRSEFRSDKRVQADVATAQIGDRIVHILKPRTFMNLSGNAVRAALKWYNVPKEKLLIVADDISLEVGRVRLRAKGSAGGHNGLKSIESALGSREYARLKVGVGTPGAVDEWKDHVLGRFSRGDMKVLEDVLWDCAEILDMWTGEESIERVISRVGTIASGKK